jgi:hypothetical protein
MTGNQLAMKLKSIKGKVYIQANTPHDAFYIPVEKAALIKWLSGCGDSETGMRIDQQYDCSYFEVDQNLL